MGFSVVQDFGAAMPKRGSSFIVNSIFPGLFNGLADAARAPERRKRKQRHRGGVDDCETNQPNRWAKLLLQATNA